MPTDRDVQYGTIAVKNNFLTQEQFDESIQIRDKLQRREAAREILIEEILFEKGYISDSQNQVVLSVIERLQQKGRGDARKTATLQRTVTCPHCGAPNLATVADCESCQGPLVEKQKAAALKVVEVTRDCPHCGKGLPEDALQCPCGTIFCPVCKHVREPAAISCDHCGLLFPQAPTANLGAAARSRAAAPLAPPPDVNPTKLYASLAGGALLLVGLLVFLFTRGGGEERELAELAESLAALRGEVERLWSQRNWPKAKEQLDKLLEASERLAQRAKKDETRLGEARLMVSWAERKREEVDKLLVARVTGPGPEPVKPITHHPVGPDPTKKGPDPATNGGKTGPEKDPTKGDGKTSGPVTPPRTAFLPEEMTTGQLQEAVEELGKLGVELPAAPAVDASKMAVIFLKSGEEVVGTVEKDEEKFVKLRPSKGGGQRTIMKNQIVHRADGRTYDRGPQVDYLLNKQGKPVAGKPTHLEEAGVRVEDGANVRIVPKEEIQPASLYRTARYLKDAQSADLHFELGRLAWSLGLREEATREFLESAKEGPTAMLRVLPYLHPAHFVRWRLKRKVSKDEVLQLVGWGVTNMGPTARVELLRGAIQAAPTLQADGEVQLHLAVALIDDQQFLAAQTLLGEIQGRFSDPVKSKATALLTRLKDAQAKGEHNKQAADTKRVMEAFFSALEREANEICRKYQDWKQVEEHAKGRPIFDECIRVVAKQTKLTEEQVTTLFEGRSSFTKHYKGLKLDYRHATWLVDPPGIFRYELGDEGLTKMQREFWQKLERNLQVEVVRGMFCEMYLLRDGKGVTKAKCPICSGNKAITDLTGLNEQMKRLCRRGCYGTGYHRQIQVE